MDSYIMKTGTLWRRGIYACLSVAAAVSACSDAPVETTSLPYIPVQPRFAALRGSVNLSTGTMTFDADPASHTPTGLYAQIYGVQNVSVRLYNSTVQIDSITTPGVKRITTMVGMENLLGH